jgi:hypothetical protein
MFAALVACSALALIAFATAGLRRPRSSAVAAAAAR